MQANTRAGGQKPPMVVYTVRLRPEVVRLLRTKVPYAKIRHAIEHCAVTERVDRKDSLWPVPKRRRAPQTRVG